jgi:hypothetical protein
MPTLSTQAKDAPLTVKVRGGKLVIEIGINVLAFAAANHPDYVWEDGSRVKVVDPLEFAKDIRNALLGEVRYEGPSRIEDFLDKATTHAIEDGCLSVLLDGEPNDG